MQKNQIIAVFNGNLEATAFVGLKPEIYLEVLSTKDADEVNGLKSLVLSLNTRMPKIRKESFDEGIISVDLETVEPTSKHYINGIAEELMMAGFMVKIVPEVIKPIVVYISEKMTKEKREKILGEIVNLPSDIEKEAVAELQNVLEECNKL
jgi:hypothetical protein